MGLHISLWHVDGKKPDGSLIGRRPDEDALGWNAKNHSMIMQSKDFVERVYHLLKERSILKLSIISFTEMVEREGIVKVLKGLEVWKTTGKGENKSVYCDPYIWILLAMELNGTYHLQTRKVITK